MKHFEGKEFDDNVRLNWLSAEIYLNKKAKEKSRKREMQDLKEYCQAMFGKDWRWHYLKKWKARKRGK